jgi:hypothetical protein
MQPTGIFEHTTNGHRTSGNGHVGAQWERFEQVQHERRLACCNPAAVLTCSLLLAPYHLYG